MANREGEEGRKGGQLGIPNSRVEVDDVEAVRCQDVDVEAEAEAEADEGGERRIRRRRSPPTNNVHFQ